MPGGIPDPDDQSRSGPGRIRRTTDAAPRPGRPQAPPHPPWGPTSLPQLFSAPPTGNRPTAGPAPTFTRKRERARRRPATPYFRRGHLQSFDRCRPSRRLPTVESTPTDAIASERQ
ncbi:hypothetical protein J2S69_003755 [Glycomyces lechevalierae]|uniref:Uncharacterized protein n=1 Tax=Glycomyces lechevalierae TaxID=256034 RepID=A0ABU2AS51_9ACTN|nr:hypothetical protein [Glycomyces lechevalierae]